VGGIWTRNATPSYNGEQIVHSGELGGSGVGSLSLLMLEEVGERREDQHTPILEGFKRLLS
jgi:hypothetical protein